MNANKQNLINTKTLIVGAGISGIAAALNLLKHNYKDYIQIEANNRIGGRIHTIEHENDVIEMGAQFLHGQINNPIFEFARDNKLINESDFEITNENTILNIGFYKDSNNYYASDNGQRLSSDLVNRANKCFDATILNAKKTSADYLTEENDISLGDFFLENYYKLTDDEFKNELNSPGSEQVKNVINSVFNWRCKCECSINGSASVFDLSLKHYKTYIDLGGNLHVMPIKGYKSVIDKMISYHGKEFNERLMLSNSIKKILIHEENFAEHSAYTDDRKKLVVIVENINESSDLIIICDNVLFTVSLGYLKSNFTNIIQQHRFIPKKKLKAIDRVGFGTVNKMFLIFEKRFWDEDLDNIWLLRKCNGDSSFIDRLKKPALFENDWKHDIIDFDVLEGESAVLLCWINQNEYFEKLDDDAVKLETTKILNEFLGRNDIPNPIRVIRSKWQTNKYFNGSYSYMAFGADDSDFRTLADPIEIDGKNRIFFAGEHTHETYFSTVHGAYLTGVRESERILNS